MPTLLETHLGAERRGEAMVSLGGPPVSVIDPVYLDVQNVAQYLRTNQQQQLRVVTSLPLTPPWEHTWVEYTRPSNGDRHAFLITRYDLGEGRDINGDLVRWSLLWSPLHCPHSDHITRVGVPFVLYLRPDGSLSLGPPDQDGGPRVYLHNPKPDLVPTMFFDEYTHVMIPEIGLVAFSFALLNCKNVVVEDQVTPPKLAARRLQKHGVPSVTRKVLRVVPLAQAHRHPGETVPLDHSPRALHIRRGYFGDYREGRGLFGKFHGVYWWDQAIRGSRAAGEVVKSYELEQPEGVR